MFLADNFGMFHWELSSMHFYISWEKTHGFQIFSLFSVSEEQYSKTFMHRINYNVYSARLLKTSSLKQKKENVWECHLNVANKS